jgi:glutathione S-transferase
MFPGPRLIPEDPRIAAVTEQWISAVNTVVDRTMIRTYLFSYIFPKTTDGQPDRPAIDEVMPTVREQVDILDKAVADTGYLAGEQFTLADINLMPILYYVRNLPEGGAAIGAAKNLSAYYERNAQRPSFKSTIPPPVPRQQTKADDRKAGVAA